MKSQRSLTSLIHPNPRIRAPMPRARVVDGAPVFSVHVGGINPNPLFLQKGNGGGNVGNTCNGKVARRAG
jgi:hypothetical protein